MVIPPLYTLTPSMLTSFSKVEANKLLLQHREIPLEIIENLHTQSLLKSSLFSAKIEGNTLTLAQIKDDTDFDPSIKERLEVANILQAFSFLQGRIIKDIDRDCILKLHSIVMNGLTD